MSKFVSGSFQLGHDFSAMDSMTEEVKQVAPVVEFQLGHDFSAMDSEEKEKKERDNMISFNWATTFQPWIANNKRVKLATRRETVSIGPRLFSHG